MTLRIGNKGFTLIEVMVAVAVLSLGIVLIFESFFISLDAFNYYFDYLNVASWVNEKVWQAQDNISRFAGLADMKTSGSFVIRNKKFTWNLSYGLTDGREKLYRIDLALAGQQGKRPIRLSRTAYAIYEERIHPN